MQQLTQELKSGHMEILEVPFPALNKGQVLVRNHYSVISAGTEGKTVSDARKGYIAKAKSRQKEVRQVIEMIKTNGFRETYKLVMNKLEAPSSLGYSCAGEVIAVAGDVNDLKPGDLVACGGQGAFHADVVSVFRNLCVKVPEGQDLKHAAFATIASIAIQGIRQAELKFGETCLIIGLGLIGQLSIQILKAAGIKVTGVDISEDQVKLAKENGADLALNRNQEGIEKMISRFTDGHGVDAIIITAGTSSADPVNFAGAVARRKAKVVIVGAVPTGFDRPNYYKKELDLRMSSSYGPGRYDMNYEEKGIDYPVEYVRWTENRNMQAFIDLLSAGKLNMDKLITHTFNLEGAPEAYNMILEKAQPLTGVLIQYDHTEPAREVHFEKVQALSGKPEAGFIGAGNFAQNMLLPRLKGLCNFAGISTAFGNESRYVAKKYGFKYCTDSGDKIVEDENINTVFIVTRHNLHAEYIKKALLKGKNIFVEKPLTMNLEELEEIRQLYVSKSGKGILMLGFNRRFSPHIQFIREKLHPCQPRSINIRINAGTVPKDHWIHDPAIGGGRIIGEACHFIDLAMYLADASINSVYATEIKDPDNLKDTVNINLTFTNGSIANISYFSNGNKAVSKEYLEVFCDGTVGMIDDFKKSCFYGTKKSTFKTKGQDKGHTAELKQFINSIEEGKASPISFEEIYLSTLATFKVIESISLKKNLEVLAKD